MISDPLRHLSQQLTSDKITIISLLLIGLVLTLYRAMKEECLSWVEIEKMIVENVLLFGIIRSRKHNVPVYLSWNLIRNTSVSQCISHNQDAFRIMQKFYKSRILFFMSDTFFPTMVLIFAGSMSFIILQQRSSFILLIGAIYLCLALLCRNSTARTTRRTRALAEDSERNRQNIEEIVQLE